MKVSNLKTLACIIAIVLAPSIAFAGGTNATTEDKASTGQSKDPDPGMKEGDMGLKPVGQEPMPDSVIVNDSTLTTSVRDALKADPNLKNLDIKAKVSNGVVTLTGDAKDMRWKARATVVANSVKGVKSVENNMKIGRK